MYYTLYALQCTEAIELSFMQFATPCVVIQRKRKRAQTCIAVQHMVCVQSMAFKYSSKPRACEGQGMQLVYLFRCYAARKRVEAFVSLFLILLARHDEGSTHPMQGIYYRACVDGAHTGAGKSLHRKALHGKARHGLARK